MPRSTLAVAVTCALLAACHDTPVECPAADFADGGLLPDGATGYTLVVGTEDSSGARVATPWTDGLHVPLVHGSQGAWMIRPSMDVTTPAPLPENSSHLSCLKVQFVASTPSSFPLVDSAIVHRVDGTTSTYHVPALLGALDYDRASVDGYPTRITVTVLADSGGATTTLTVVPDSMAGP